MIDLIMAYPAEGPATLFTRNFRVHSGIPIGLYEDGYNSPLALIYGDITLDVLKQYSGKYRAIIGMPLTYKDEIPENPMHYETMTVKAPILATLRKLDIPGFKCFLRTFEGEDFVLEGEVDGVPVMLFTADLIKATIRILSGELEQDSGIDSNGRHNPPPESVIKAPAVSFHFNLIENLVKFLYRKIGQPLFYIPRWPNSAPLALFLSHDVDVVRKWTVKRSVYELMLATKKMLLLKGASSFTETLTSIINAMKGMDPYWMFDELLFMENGHGFKSTWFFAPLGEKYKERENSFDPVYHRKASQITSMIRRIVDSDCEFALHGTRRAYMETDILREQIDSYESRLGFKIHGVRHHYLMFRHGRTLEAVSRAGLMYDTTLGFSDRPGFRNGIAAPFFPFPYGHDADKIVEIPLNFMDGVFLHAEDGIEGASRRITESYIFAKAAGGLFTALVHPGNMDKKEIDGVGDYYRSFLPRCRLDRAHSMTGSELASWWQARENILRAMELGPNMWRIKGVTVPKGMDFAVIARDIKSRKFYVDGVKGNSEIVSDRVLIRPESVDPEKGMTIVTK